MNDFWNGKQVFLTGHTGFKGSWMCRILANWGAYTTGYALEPLSSPNLFSISAVDARMDSIIGDIRDREKLLAAFRRAKPEIAIHMAAQPLVRESYREPAETYETNVIGTVNIMECLRLVDGVRSFLNVTTDKVYYNNEWQWGYRETDRLGGKDPYSNSKSCSELVTNSYMHSFFAAGIPAVSTARAGNVIGGGDFSMDRIIPDCVRAAIKNEPILVRNPFSTRPYQHVLESLSAYLLIAQKQYEDASLANSYNIGPEDTNCIATGDLAELFCRVWGDGVSWTTANATGPHEAGYLKLDCSKIKSLIGWKPQWDIETAVAKTIEWTKAYLQNDDICAIMDKHIDEYFNWG